MINNVTTTDGQLGYAPSQAPVYVVGQASAGSVSQLNAIGDASLIYPTWMKGPLPDRIGVLFSQKVGPVAGLRMAQSNAGSIGTVEKTPANASGTPQEFFGSVVLAGATDGKGAVLLRSIVPGVTITVVQGMAAAFTASGLDITLTVVSTTTTGANVVALSQTAVAALIAAPTLAGDTGNDGSSLCDQAVSKKSFDDGAIIYTALVQACRLIAGADSNGGTLYSSNNTGLSVVHLTGTSKTLGVTQAGLVLTVQLGTDNTGTVTSTGLQIEAAVNASTAALALGMTALHTGTGAGLGAAQSVLALGAPSVTHVLPITDTQTLSAVFAGNTLTISSATDSHGRPTSTGTLTLAAIPAYLAGVLSATEAGSGAGVIGAKSITILPFGSTGVLTATGSPLDQYHLQVQTPRAGGVGVGTFRVALDDLPTWGPEMLIPGGGSYAIPGTGITLGFSGTFGAGDAFTAPITAATSTAGDLSAALVVLSGLTGQGGDLAITGGLSGAMATMVTSWIGTERAAGRIWVVQLESRDYTPGETDAAFVASLNADFASVSEPAGRLWAVPGWWDTSIPGQGISRRPFAWTVGAQIWSLPEYVNPVCVEDGGGPIPGLFTPTTPIQPQTHDERLSPGLGGSGGRWATVQSFPGAPGAWYTGDAAGNRSPGTFAPALSDWSLLMNARLGARVERLLLAYGPQLLGSRYDTVPPGLPNAGALTVPEQNRVAGKIAQFLSDNLVGALSAPPIVTVSPVEPIKSSKKLVYTVTLPTWAYALELDGQIGLQ